FSNAVNSNFVRVLSAQEQHAIACNEIAAERKQMAHRAYRLGLDVGTNSIGWFIVWLNAESEAYALGPGGVRIFPDGRDPKGTSNASGRRDARSARWRRDRYLRRRAELMEALVRHGLMPADRAE